MLYKSLDVPCVAIAEWETSEKGRSEEKRPLVEGTVVKGESASHCSAPRTATVEVEVIEVIRQ